MSKEDGTPITAPKRDAAPGLLDWIKVIGPLVISWPLVVLVVILVFKGQLVNLSERFNQSEEGRAEFGPIKIALGKLAVIPPQYRHAADSDAERIDLSASIGEIRDTGPDSTTVGFAVAYALQAEIQVRKGQRVTLSPRGIYFHALRLDEFAGEGYEGTSLEGGLKAVKEVGAYLESDWPYANKGTPAATKKPSFRISRYRQVNGAQEFVAALRDQHVVVATVMVTEDFDAPGADGTVAIKLPLRNPNLSGSKAIAIVGYDSRTASFTFANDWGTAWGRGGFGVIRDTDLIQILGSAFVIEL